MRGTLLVWWGRARVIARASGCAHRHRGAVSTCRSPEETLGGSPISNNSWSAASVALAIDRGRLCEAWPSIDVPEVMGEFIDLLRRDRGPERGFHLFDFRAPFRHGQRRLLHGPACPRANQ